MAWDDGLQGTHLEIAKWPGDRLRVVAGPGTGKTFALMRRVARLLEDGVAGSRILAVTFTRTAARDLVDKLAELGVPDAENVRASTLHSLCFSVLGRAAVLELTGRQARPLVGHERSALVCDLKDDFGGKRAVEDLLRAFDAAWATLQSHDPGWPQDQTQRQFHVALMKWLYFHKAMLIGELVPLALDFVRNNPLSPDAPSYDFVLADEYQDLNRADQELVELLARDGAITVVGDEDQSIYSFRNAHPEGITEYTQAHAGTHNEALSECRRCPTTVVHMAASLIGRNTRARTDLPTPMQGNLPGNVSVLQHQTLDEEVATLSRFVADAIVHSNGTILPSDILILTNRRKIGYALRTEINRLANSREQTWSAQSFFTEEALDEVCAQRGFTLLSLMVDPADRASYRAWLGIGHQDYYHRQYRKLWTLAEQLGVSPREAAIEVLQGKHALSHCAQIMARAQELEQLLPGLSVDPKVLTDELFDPADASCSDIREMALSLSDEAKTPADLLDGLRTLITQPELPPDPSDVVRIMSLHKSKGLTAKVVIVAGCLEGILPFVRTGLEEADAVRALEEQRRLFYVAITRPTRTLVLSCCLRMPLADAMSMNARLVGGMGATVQVRTSRFLGELGPSRPAMRTDIDHWITEQPW